MGDLKRFKYWEREYIWLPKTSSLSNEHIPAMSYVWHAWYGTHMPGGAPPISHHAYLTEEEYTFAILGGLVE